MIMNTYVFGDRLSVFFIFWYISMKHIYGRSLEAWPIVTVYSLTSHVVMDGNYKFLCYGPGHQVNA